MNSSEAGVRPRFPIPLPFLAVPALAFLVASCGPDLGQAKLCERALSKLADNPGAIDIIAREEVPGAATSIRLTYKRTGRQQSDAAKGWIVCRFDGGGSAGGRLELVGVETSTLGKLRMVALVVLRRQMGYRQPPPEHAGR